MEDDDADCESMISKRLPKQLNSKPVFVPNEENAVSFLKADIEHKLPPSKQGGGSKCTEF